MMKPPKTNSISLYLNKIGNYPVLTSDEERMLAKKWLMAVLLQKTNLSIQICG